MFLGMLLPAELLRPLRQQLRTLRRRKRPRRLKRPRSESTTRRLGQTASSLPPRQLSRRARRRSRKRSKRPSTETRRLPMRKKMRASITVVQPQIRNSSLRKSVKTSRILLLLLLRQQQRPGISSQNSRFTMVSLKQRINRENLNQYCSTSSGRSLINSNSSGKLLKNEQ